MRIIKKQTNFADVMKKTGKILVAIMVIVAGIYFIGSSRANAANTVTVAGQTVTADSQLLNLAGARIEDLNQFILELSALPCLAGVDLSNSNLSNEQMEVLQATFP